jgi:hypothetical protein
VSPAILDLPYSETEPVEFEMTVINDDSKDIAVEVSYESYEGKIDYKDYFEITNFESGRIELAQNERKTVHFRMNYPPMESFGNVKFAFVKFYQVPSSLAQIAATVALLIPLRSDIPYPPKFVSMNMPNLFYVKNGEKVNLNATLSSLGSETINLLLGHFDVAKGDYLKEVEFETLESVGSGAVNVVSADFDTTGVKPGVYYLNATVNYDGIEKTLGGKKLIIGEESVEIIDVKPKEFVKGQINTVQLVLANLWAEDLSPEIKIDLVKEGVFVKTYDLGKYTLPVSENKDIFYGMDLSGVPAGDYVLRVSLDLSGKVIAKDFDVVLAENVAASENNNFIWMVMFGIVILILLSIIGYLFYKRKS